MDDKIDLKPEQIKRKEKIGELDEESVIEIETKGGLVLETVMRRGTPKILGVGSHRAISRFIARRDNPTLKIDQLHKSEDLPDEILKLHVDEFSELTKKMQEIEDDET